MSDLLYYVFCAILSLGVLYGVRLMSKVETASTGNRVSAACMLFAIVITMIRTDLSGSLVYIIAGLLIGTLLSIYMTFKVRMIWMPQMVGLLNGLGGLASGLAAFLTVAADPALPAFEMTASGLALAVGALTFSGSMVAAGKLHGVLPQRPFLFAGQRSLSALVFLIMAALLVALPFMPGAWLLLCLMLLFSGLIFGLLFAFRVGGADMPITISLLNSTSGVAAAIAGMALGNILLVTIGGIVGASGLLLTQIMCRWMNRSVFSVLFGNPIPKTVTIQDESVPKAPTESTLPSINENAQEQDAGDWLKVARSVVIVPGYGMAISQAQEKIKLLSDKLEVAEKTVRFAIHPVAGRMPGHMNVLLAEVDIPYEKLFEMEEINSDFSSTDLAIVVGANDVINPAANIAQGTPIYGMPVLNVSQAKRLIICNFDNKPGYAGVPNPLYEPLSNVLLLLGDAKDSIDQLLGLL